MMFFGKLRVVLRLSQGAGSNVRQNLRAEMQEAGGSFWPGELVVVSEASEVDSEVDESVWGEGEDIGPGIRVAARLRSKGSWARPLTDPPWPAELGGARQPIIIAFYSFKGGVGRTTALAAFALHRAEEGERTVVVDLDLDAPGAGVFLSPGGGLPGARRGVADYLLEQNSVTSADLADYYHACQWQRGTTRGGADLFVIPAGTLDENYLGKIARVDLEPPPGSAPHPLARLLSQVKDELAPDWIPLDCRAGLSDAAGFALAGMAHLYVLFGTASEQSWHGLRLVLDRLGAQRIRRGQPQAECVLVQALVPQGGEAARKAKEIFLAQAQDWFSEHYYAADPEDPEEDRCWYVRDMASEDAPHVPVPLHYTEALAHVQSVHDVAEHLSEGNQDFRKLSARIVGRFLTGG